MNQSIELPPLPEARIVSYQTDSTMRSMELRTYSDQDMQEYARAAIEPYAQRIAELEAQIEAIGAGGVTEGQRLIEADRKRRGEPVGYFYPWELERSLKAYPNGFPGAVAVYAAPQPLEPSRSEPVVQFRKEHCADWYDGYPDHSDGGGPYETRTLYTSPQPAEPVKKIEIKAEDLSIITYSPTPRPQWVSHIDRGVRVVHLPTGLMAECHEERSPHRNREIALAKLKEMIAAEPVSQHPDDVAVDAFAAAMKAKLKRAREEKDRGGWQDMSATVLSDMLREHVQKGDPVDVANLAMMLHQNGQGIAPAEPVKVPSVELQCLADRAYCQYLEQMRRPECKGVEYKLENHKFGVFELAAHNKAYEHLGRYKAFSEAAALLARYGQPTQLAEPWYGHKFKEHTDGTWRCVDGCGPVLAAQPAEPSVSTTQALITLGKVIAGYRPGDEGWSQLDQQTYDATMEEAKQSQQERTYKGDIVGWLRRRRPWDQLIIPGKLAGEIADHIEALQAQLKPSIQSPATTPEEEEAWRQMEGKQ